MSLRKNKYIRKNAEYKEGEKRKSVLRWGWRAEGVWMWEFYMLADLQHSLHIKTVIR